MTFQDWWNNELPYNQAIEDIDELAEAAFIAGQQSICRENAALRKWEDIPKEQQRATYWKAIPNDSDCIDGLDFEIVYVYYDGQYAVFRPGDFRVYNTDKFTFLYPIDC